ncbi:ArsR family transcriptional regulator [Anoxybacillus voinovskiensis]|uniref:ArsR family transcriptional regulator n=1 Tax=Anoxybacteroides voinovskiense TaxID=230470 RepID=A0A840DQR1_9BACL|nr:metalloregulator ArsR/SmtB family transcription factor [Anoxybacillus voinovskiensis]MBB4075471.1 ArsR family transcriptional regulator [Anoxybacillus voinovskiensis]GGJ79554.1 HTH-type transcriptional repressor AseR [Anoxybacillus voinovskiensis]
MQQTVVRAEEMASILKLLGDRTRLTMMAMLNKNDRCVCELVEFFQMSQPAISQHLRKLKDAGLVKETRKAQWIFYSANKDHSLYSFIQAILSYLPEERKETTQLCE